MKDTIQRHLAEIEAHENVRIAYACESGSRAWGFPSADSDYAVRFIYIRPVDWYLSICEQRDVIERPIQDGLDICGWDIIKALRLFRKSNPPLLEWLGSPVVYLEKYTLAARMRALSAEYYSPIACFYHYLNMGQGNFRQYLKGDTVWLKKYFYVLRPVLAMQWIEQQRGVAPTDFNILVDQLVTEPILRAAIDNLLAEKRLGAELDRGPRITAISDFIERELERWENSALSRLPQSSDENKLDELFRACLAEAWR